jgi:hypothetical protein
MPYNNRNDDDKRQEAKYKITFWSMLGILFCLLYMLITK